MAFLLLPKNLLAVFYKSPYPIRSIYLHPARFFGMPGLRALPRVLDCRLGGRALKHRANIRADHQGSPLIITFSPGEGVTLAHILTARPFDLNVSASRTSSLSSFLARPQRVGQTDALSSSRAPRSRGANMVYAWHIPSQSNLGTPSSGKKKAAMLTATTTMRLPANQGAT
jgi:hypothetical protein